MEDLIRRNDAIEAVQRCCPDTSMYRAIRDIPSADTSEIYEQGMKDAWKIAQMVFDSTVTLYEAKDVARCIGEKKNE